MTSSSPSSKVAEAESFLIDRDSADAADWQDAVRERHDQLQAQLQQILPRDSSDEQDSLDDKAEKKDQATVEESELNDDEDKDEDDDEDEDEDDDDDLDDLFFFSTPYTNQKLRNQRQLRLLDERRELPPLQPSVSDQQRPTTARSQLRVFHRQGGRSRSTSISKQLRPATGGLLQSHFESWGSKSMSKEEFSALPPTIQRKYFSTLERLRFAQANGGGAAAFNGALDGRQDFLNRSQSSLASLEEDNSRQSLENSDSSDTLTLAPGRLRRVYSSTARLCTSPGASAQSQITDNSSDSLDSFILDATDEAVVRISKRRSQSLKQGINLGDPNYTFFLQPAMDSPVEDDNASLAGPNPTEDALDDCFRWLEGDSDLDLRLQVKQSQNKEDGDLGQRKRPLLFGRRQDSSKITKLSNFGRACDGVSRPGTKDAMSPPPFDAPLTASLSSPQSFSRRKSRALSMIVPISRNITPEASSAVDPAACHYQDPETRMKLRVYLASPHKFDEAVEFGFPSLNDVQDPDEAPHGRSMSVAQESHHQTSLRPVPHIEDEIASLCSDPVSPTELEFPKTPESMGRPVLTRAIRSSEDAIPMAKIDYSLAPASCREMTLRMTLTRPDLRADEDQMYGWQKSGRKLPPREDPVQPRAYNRAGSHNKDDIERQLAEIDHEVLSNDGGVVKRFWNRVRRS